MVTTKSIVLNGLNLADLRNLVESVAAEPRNAGAGFHVVTRWTGGTTTRSRVASWTFRGEEQRRSHILATDEPVELGGTDQHANPQEMLMSALNGCLTVGYVAAAALMGIEIEFLSIETTGTLDLRGFLGLAPVNPGYDEVHYIVRLKAPSATREQLEELHRTVIATSPNYANFARAITMKPRLVIQ